MSRVKITELPSIGDLDITPDDIFPVVDAPQGAVPVTKALSVNALFEKAPVTSVAGKSGGAVTLGSADLTNADDVALLSVLGTLKQFTDRFNNTKTP